MAPTSRAPKEICGRMHDPVTEPSTDVESELSLFSFLLAETPDRVYFKDRDGRFVRASAATAAFFGCTPEQLLGTTDFDYLAEASARGSFEEELRIAETGEPHLDLE